MRNLLHCNLSLQAQVDFNAFESAVMIEFVTSIDKLSVDCINAIWFRTTAYLCYEYDTIAFIRNAA